jgi:putative effector of murein hydrolase LrgA (UPF0299 family)
VLSAITLLIVLQLVGEVIARGLALPIPGPVIGLVLLLVGLIVHGARGGRSRGASPDALEETSQGLLRHLSLLFVPAGVSDRSDGKIAHLDGLNLSRAWCWREIAGSLATDDPRRPIALRAAEDHLDAALPHVTGDYMGEHWLASFALLALLAPEGSVQTTTCAGGPVPA